MLVDTFSIWKLSFKLIFYFEKIDIYNPYTVKSFDHFYDFKYLLIKIIFPHSEILQLFASIFIKLDIFSLNSFS